MRLAGESVLLIHNTPRTDAPSERGVLEQAAAVSAALERLGIPFAAVGVRALRDLPAVLLAHPARLVFNLAEAFPEDPEDANRVPAVCRAFGREATGNDSAALGLALDKAVAKAVLRAAGVPAPDGVTVAPGEDLPGDRLKPGRYIVKPLRSDASEGIDARSVADWPGAGLADAVRRVHHEMNQPAEVEAFYGTRELNVSLAEIGGDLNAFPAAEIDFSAFGPDRPRIVGYEAKWLTDSFEYRNTPRLLPAPLSAVEAARVADCARAAWRAMGCRDYARVDLRMDARGVPVVIEVNPNPDISPEAGFAKALEAAGLTYDAFVEGMLENARRRLGGDPPVLGAHAKAGAGPAAIRRLEPGDREAVLDLVRRTNFFRPDEVEIAREVLDDALRDGPGGHYQSFVIEAAGRPAGWVCFGPTPCTVGTFDIYWIAVDPAVQGRGLGRALLEHAERLIAARGGKLCVLETSGRAEYQSTRGFYLKCGYLEEAGIADYYGPGDAMMVYVKRLG